MDHTLTLHVTGDDENAVHSTCADIDAFLAESESTEAWDAAVSWEWQPRSGIDATSPEA